MLRRRRYRYPLWSRVLDYVIVGFFIADYIANFYLAKDRIAFVFSIFSIIDLLAIIPVRLVLLLLLLLRRCCCCSIALISSIGGDRRRCCFFQSPAST